MNLYEYLIVRQKSFAKLCAFFAELLKKQLKLSPITKIVSACTEAARSVKLKFQAFGRRLCLLWKMFYNVLIFNVFKMGKFHTVIALC